MIWLFVYRNIFLTVANDPLFIFYFLFFLQPAPSNDAKYPYKPLLFLLFCFYSAN